MNYASPYTPAYTPVAAYAQQYPYAMAPLAGQQFLGPMVQADPNAPVVAAPVLSLLSGAWWQQTSFGIPRWALGLGLGALTGIGLAWNAGMFGKKANGGARRAGARRDPNRGRSNGGSRGRSGGSMMSSGGGFPFGGSAGSSSGGSRSSSSGSSSSSSKRDPARKSRRRTKRRSSKRRSGGRGGFGR